MRLIGWSVQDMLGTLPAAERDELLLIIGRAYVEALAERCGPPGAEAGERASSDPR